MIYHTVERLNYKFKSVIHNLHAIDAMRCIANMQKYYITCKQSFLIIPNWAGANSTVIFTFQ